MKALTLCEASLATVVVVVSSICAFAPGCGGNPITPTDGGTDSSVGPCGPGTATMCGATCADIQSDHDNCGKCGNVCPTEEVCSHGACATVCGGGTSRCGNDCVDLTADVTHCGGCNTVCPSGNVCSKGTCALTCQAGLTNCNGDCVDITQSDGNCSACGMACPNGQVCQASQCVATCQSGWSVCNNACADTQHDVTNCGSCGNKCPSGEFCSPVAGVGTCGIVCLGGTSLCSGACVDESIDKKNCGGCASVCAGNCSAGHCCSSGQVYCGGCDTLANCITKSGGRMSLGYDHTCGINASGTLKCWGYGSDGELGDGSSTDSSTPLTVSLSGTTNIGLGSDSSCAIANGKAYCWGYDYEGECGVGTDSDTYASPQQLSLSNVLKIDGGGDNGCALLSNQSVYCWGGNYSGEVGDGTETEQDSPVSTGITNAVDVSAGVGYTACAVISGGTVKCWGDNSSGECGDGTSNFQNDSPVSVSGLTNVLAVSVGYYHACALLTSGDVWCWGQDYWGELGDGGSFTTSNVPVHASVVSGVTAIAAGGDGYYEHTCVLTGGGAVKCWGSNAEGQLGDGTYTDNPSPVTPVASGAVAIAAGAYHTCAMLGDGSAKCWGNNDYGQLGDGTTTSSPSPVKVSGF